MKYAAVVLTGLFLAARSYGAGEFNQYSVAIKFGTNWVATTNWGAYPVLPPDGYVSSRLNPSDVAGVPSVAQAHWNNFLGTNDLNAQVWDNSGAIVSGMLLKTFAPTLGGSVNGYNEFNTTNLVVPSVTDYVLMSTYIEQDIATGDGSPSHSPQVTISNVPPALTTPGYDIYVYAQQSDVGNRCGFYTLTDLDSGNVLATNLFTSATNNTSLIYTWSYIGHPGTAQTNNSWVALQNGNYVVFRGVHSQNFLIYGSTAGQAGSYLGAAGSNLQPRTPINGIQLVAASVTGMPAPAASIKMDTSMKKGMADVSWDAGGAANILVVMRRNIPVMAEPVAGTSYIVGQDMGNDGLGLSNMVIYAGAATTTNVTVTGLTNGATYWVTAYTWSGSAGAQSYRISGQPRASAVAIASVTNITVTPALPSLVLGGAGNVSVMGHLDSGDILDVRASCTYSSTVPGTVVSMTNYAGRYAGAAIGGPANIAVTYPTNQYYTNALLSLSTAVGSPGVMVRQSPTLPSIGGTTNAPSGSGAAITSFFDVWLEVSTNSGSTWSPSTSSVPLHLVMSATSGNNLAATFPPGNVTWAASPSTSIQRFDNGVILSNISLSGFTSAYYPPPVGSGEADANNAVLNAWIANQKVSNNRFTNYSSASTPVTIGITNISPWGGLVASASVSVVAGYLDHVYSFTGTYITNVDNGTTAYDIGPAPYGKANGIEVGTIPGGFGEMGFGGAAYPAYVYFPSGTLTNYGAATFEAWFQDTGTGANGRLYDYGNAQLTSATASNGVAYTYFTPNQGTFRERSGLLVPGFNLNANGVPQESVTDAFAPSTNNTHHLVITMNGLNRTHMLYVDGLQVGVNTNINQVPADMGLTTNNFWGRSQSGGATPLNGALYEFRTYTTVLSPLQVSVNNATGPDTMVNAAAIGACTGLTLYATNVNFPYFPWNNPMGDDDYEQVTLLAKFASLGGGSTPVNITTLSNSVVYSSGDTNVFTVDALGNVTPTRPGTATLTATAFSQTATLSITIVAVPTTLEHRYSFTSDASDSIGHYDGFAITTGYGSAVFSGGQVFLNGEARGNNAPAEGFIQLPNGMFDNYNSITLEAWYTEYNDGTWARIWDFGSGTSGNLFATPNDGGTGTTNPGVTNTDGTIASGGGNFRVAMTIGGGGGEQQVNTWRPLPHVEHHVVYTVQAALQRASLYVDGALVVVNPQFTLRPRNIPSTTANYLGRSQYNDPSYNGSINEFRMYKGAITPDWVLMDYSLGPDALPTSSQQTNGLGSFLNTGAIVVPGVAAGSNAQARVNANFANFSSANVTAWASNWTSSDVTKARVDMFGMVYGVSVGGANISAQFGGATLNGSVTVGAAVNPTLLHRYSFDSTANDSVGSAHGTLLGQASIASGTVVLPGGQMTNPATGGSAVMLPGHLFDGLKDVTIEAWATGNYLSNYANSARLWDFGSWEGTNNGNGNSDGFSLQLDSQGNNSQGGHVAIRHEYQTAGYQTLSANQLPNTNGLPGWVYVYSGTNIVGTNFYTASDWVMSDISNRVHYTVVLSSSRQRTDIYVNGKLWDSTDWGPTGWLYGDTNHVTPSTCYPIAPEHLLNNVGFLGRAVCSNLFGVGTLDYVGTIDEVRIWQGSLNKLQAQVTEFYGPSNAVANAGSASALRLTLNDPSMILGSLQQPTVRADFTGTDPSLTNLDLTGLQTVTLASSDTSKVVVTADGLLQAVGTGGPVIVTATYGGRTATASVSVVPQGLTLTHRYSWTSDARDTVGQADGTLMGQAYVSNNAVVLSGVPRPPTYVALPGWLVGGYDQISLEAWLITTSPNAWTRVIDCGLRENATGREFFNLNAPGSAVNNTTAQLGPSPAISQYGINVNGGNVRNVTNAWQHVVCTLDGTQGTNSLFTIYVNGAYAPSQRATNVYFALLSQVLRDDRMNQIGRSMSGGDNFYVGQMTEVRTYYGALSSNQVAASFASGPYGVGGLAIANAGGGKATLSWPGTGAANDPAATATLVSSPTIVPSATWTPVPGTPAYDQVSNRYSIDVTIGAAPVWYKLRNNTP